MTFAHTQETGDWDFIPRSAAFFAINEPKPPRDFHFVVLPRFTLQAVSSAIEPLRISNQLSQKELYRWRLAAETRYVHSSGGTEIAAPTRLEEIPHKSEALVCSGTDPALAASNDILAWLRKFARNGGRVGALCTGAFTLARAGLLQDRRFTLHWENQASFHENFPDLVSTQNIFEIDRGTMTCGGGSAATDLMLHVIARDYGAAFANAVSDMCLHGARRAGNVAQRTSKAFFVNSRNSNLLNAIELMENNIEEPLQVDELARYSGCSRRQLERLFKDTLNTTPARYYRSLRLDHGHGLLVETDMSVADVSIASGFRNFHHFSKCFKDRFGTYPSRIGTRTTNNINRESFQ